MFRGVAGRLEVALLVLMTAFLVAFTVLAAGGLALDQLDRGGTAFAAPASSPPTCTAGAAGFGGISIL